MYDVAILLACMVLILSVFMVGGFIADKIEEVLYVHRPVPERKTAGRTKRV